MTSLPKLAFGGLRQFIFVEESEFNEYVRKTFPELKDYSFSEAEDYGDTDTCARYVVSRTMTTARRGEFDQVLLDAGRAANDNELFNSPSWYNRTGLILDKLCNAGMIEPGEYLIEVG